VIIGQEERIQLHWNLSKENITLGGALTLRAECELISKISGQEIFQVFVTSGTNSLEKIERLFLIVFGSSRLRFELGSKIKSIPVYPDDFITESINLETFSTQRLAALHRASLILPSLIWKKEILEKIDIFFGRIKNKRNILITLKNVDNDFPDGKANLDSWHSAMQILNDELGLNFLIIGEDNLKDDLSSEDYIIRMKDLKIDLQVQLAMISLGPLFIGTASGTATPAIIGEHPYTIYKHPRHHTESMNKELVDGKFPFALDSQNFKVFSPNVDDIVADALKHWKDLET
jgi:hypothetical protein